MNTVTTLQQLGLTADEAKFLARRYKRTIGQAVASGWQPTHRIRIDGFPVEYVMLDEDSGAAYNPIEWVHEFPADWEVVDGEWRFQGGVAPVANATVTVEPILPATTA
jgi:hypothetical protein